MSHIKVEIFYSSRDYLLISHICFKFSRHGLRKVEISSFSFVTWPHMTTWTKEYATLKFVASYHKLNIRGNWDRTLFNCHVTWCVHVVKGLCNFVDNIFLSGATFLSSLAAIGLLEMEIKTFFICHVITWPRHIWVTWLCLRGYFTLNYQPVKYCDHKSCRSRDIIEVGRKIRR